MGEPATSILLELRRHFHNSISCRNQLSLQPIQRLFSLRLEEWKPHDAVNLAWPKSSLFSTHRLGVLHWFACFRLDSYLNGAQHAHLDCEDFQCLQVRIEQRKILRKSLRAFTCRPNRYNLLNDAYFWFYIVFLVVRTLGVLFCSASINDTSQKPLNLIRNVPSRYWNIDVSWIVSWAWSSWASSFNFSLNDSTTQLTLNHPRWPSQAKSSFMWREEWFWQLRQSPITAPISDLFKIIFSLPLLDGRDHRDIWNHSARRGWCFKGVAVFAHRLLIKLFYCPRQTESWLDAFNLCAFNWLRACFFWAQNS